MLKIQIKVSTVVALVSVLTGCCQTPTIYWSQIDSKNYKHHRIMRAKLDSKKPMAPETILETFYFDGQDRIPRLPFGLAVDEKAQRIYWAEPETRRIKTASLIDRKAENFPADCYVQYPIHVALDQGGHRLFWAAAGVNDGQKVEGSIEYASTQGEDKTIHVLFRDRSITGATGIALDTRRGQRRVYWLTSVGKLQSIDMDGKEQTPVDHGTVKTGEARDLAFVPSQNRFFWGNSGHGTIGWATLENGKIVAQSSFKVSNDRPFSVFADLRAMRLYWGFYTAGTEHLHWASLGGIPSDSNPPIPIETSATGIQVVYHN